jgi:crossover junction endodeoxyribonuclease RusA
VVPEKENGGGEVSDNRKQFTVIGRPVPAVRMTQKSKFVDPAAQKYLAYKDLVGWNAKAKIKAPITGEVAVTIYFYFRPGPTGDIDNYAKSILDGCNKIAWQDDRQVVELHAYRRRDRDKEYTEVEIEEMEG